MTLDISVASPKAKSQKRNPEPRSQTFRKFVTSHGSSGSSDSIRAFRTRTPASRTRTVIRSSSSSAYNGELNSGRPNRPISYSRSKSACRRAETESATRRSSSCIKRDPISRKRENNSLTNSIISTTPSHVPLLAGSSDEELDTDIDPYENTMSEKREESRLTRSVSRLRTFEAKRQKYNVFKARCFSEVPITDRSSDEYSDVEDSEQSNTINVFESTRKKRFGADTIRFRTHIKFTCELFDKHMADQYEKEQKKVGGSFVHNYWLFYQQVERFREIGKEILHKAMKLNDKKMLRDCIDEIKQELKLIHSAFLEYDSTHSIHIDNKKIMGTYSLFYERCGPFARLSGGKIKPHEMISIFDDMQDFVVDEFLEPLFIDFCCFIQFQFIVPRRDSQIGIPASPPAPRIEISGPDEGIPI